jgi:hypothetical protein
LGVCRCCGSGRPAATEQIRTEHDRRDDKVKERSEVHRDEQVTISRRLHLFLILFLYSL